MKLYKSITAIVLAGAFMASCSDDFLVPEAMSFYAPDNTYTTKSGIEAALAVCDRHPRYMMNIRSNSNEMSIGWEYMYSEMALYGKTDDGTGIQDDFAYKLTPTSLMNESGVPGFWNEGWNGVKYANTVLNYVDLVEDITEAEREKYRGQAYFHRALRYYNLVFQFGDLPLVTKLPETPKQDYKSCKKEAILEMLVHDLEIAVQNVPPQRELPYYGGANKEACRMLLAKCYLAVGKYNEAKAQCDELINNSGLALMTEPFGQFISGEQDAWAIERNVIWDLHRAENKINASNTELIMGIVNSSTLPGSNITYPWMRAFNPFIFSNIQTPDNKGNALTNYARSNGNYNVYFDYLRAMGRGIGTIRNSYFSQHPLWVVNGVEDTEDLRHNSKVGNWVNMEDLKYDNKNSAYYGQNLMFTAPEDVPSLDASGNQLYDDNGNPVYSIKKGQVLCSDTIRSWYDFPLYKTYYFSHTAENNMSQDQFNGAFYEANTEDNGNFYLFRLAEAYLVRAEANLYLGQAAQAAQDLNVLRQRAKCSQMHTTVNIGDIANERARELWWEEWRNVELTRISMCLAKSGVPDEWGNTYGENWDKQSGTDLNGGSYWYQRIVHYSIYNRGYTIQSGGALALNYTMDKRNLFWPIPYSAIQSNARGKLAQNFGYNGYDPSVEIWNTWEEAVADEN